MRNNRTAYLFKPALLSVIFFLLGTITRGQTLIDHPDVAVFPSSNIQAEVHISLNPKNPKNLQLAFNSLVGGNGSQGQFFSIDGGATWSGSETFGTSAFVNGDPATSFDLKNNDYIVTLQTLLTGLYGEVSVNDGSTWKAITDPFDATTFFSADKEMIDCDNSSSSFANNLYVAWSQVLAGGLNKNVLISRSTDGGATFSTPVTLLRNGHGANVQTGPQGNVYVCWADLGSPAAYPSSGIGFAASFNGGVSFTNPVVAFPVNGIDVNTSFAPDPAFNNIRVNNFPSMAVDKGDPCKTFSSRIYIAYPELVNNVSVIRVRFSKDAGRNWSDAVTASGPGFLQSFFPWVIVDDVTGDLYVAYLAFDQASGFGTNVYVAYSNNGGQSFQSTRVSDVPFTAQPIKNGVFNTGYMGDYIGIVAHNSQAWASWADNRNGTWQVYTSRVTAPVTVHLNGICCGSPWLCSVPNIISDWCEKFPGICECGFGNCTTDDPVYVDPYRDWGDLSIIFNGVIEQIDAEKNLVTFSVNSVIAPELLRSAKMSRLTVSFSHRRDLENLHVGQSFVVFASGGLLGQSAGLQVSAMVKAEQGVNVQHNIEMVNEIIRRENLLKKLTGAGLVISGEVERVQSNAERQAAKGGQTNSGGMTAIIKVNEVLKGKLPIRRLAVSFPVSSARVGEPLIRFRPGDRGAWILSVDRRAKSWQVNAFSDFEQEDQLGLIKILLARNRLR